MLNDITEPFNQPWDFMLSKQQMSLLFTPVSFLLFETECNNLIDTGGGHWTSPQTG